VRSCHRPSSMASRLSFLTYHLLFLGHEGEKRSLTFAISSPIVEGMASLAVLESTESWNDGLAPADGRELRWADELGAVDRRLAATCRERGPLRAVLSRIACCLVSLRAWERIGHARLSDYAVECLGLSARSVRSLARVGGRLRDFPGLEDALVSGALGWTKVRLLAQLAPDEDAARWIAFARHVTAEQLARAVRAVDRGSVEAGAAEDAGERGRLFEVRCTPEVRWKWDVARKAAARVAGRMLHVSEGAELIAAEVLSSLPIDQEPDDEVCEKSEASWSRASEAAGAGESEPSGRDTGEDANLANGAADALPPALERLIDGLENADVFELDERFRRALSMEQRLEARIAPLLVRVWGRWVHRALGYATREAYARERLGMDPTRARALVRLEYAAALSPSFARAFRSGALSWVVASALAPLVSADPLGSFVEDWVAWAGRITVRRLREDVERALALSEADPQAFQRDGGLPPGARADRGIRAQHTASEHAGAASEAGDDRETGAQHTAAVVHDWGRRDQGPSKRVPDETCWARFLGPADVVRLFNAVLCTVRCRMERDTGRLPTPGQALEAMLDHALESWGVLDDKIVARHRVFARDGWRCVVPGCTSMQNLHDHHIRFRSAGGSDGMENRVTLCAFHHLRGVHAGLVRCAGQAPDGLRWELGIRAGVTPLLVYRSGDVRVRSAMPAVGFSASI